MPEIGQPAPPFELFNIDKEKMSLDDFKGRKTLVKFLPFPFTGTCHTEMCSIRDNMSALNDLDANVVVITTTPLPSNAAWAQQEGFEFPILSDFWPHGEVSMAYGTFNEKTGGANRTTFVLDADGIVTAIIIPAEPRGAREFEQYEEALAAI
jgi:peroxiredoxin